jgi:hypothetical protein
MDNVVAFLKAPGWIGLPWGAWLFLVALLVGNQIISWAKWTKAQDLLQGLARLVLKIPVLAPVLARSPLIGWAITHVAGPEEGVERRTIIGTKKGEPPPSGAAVVLVLAAIGMMLAGSGCATARAAAVGTKHAVSEATAKAAVDFAKYDAEHQLEIVDRAPSREVARGELKAWRSGPQKKILMAFDGVNRSLELLTAALKAADAGAKQDWIGLARAILDAARSLTDALKEFEVPVPFTLPKLSLAPTPLLRDSLWFAEPLGDYIALDNKPARKLPPMPDGVRLPPGIVAAYLCDELNCTPCTGGWSPTTTNVIGGAL